MHEARTTTKSSKGQMKSCKKSEFDANSTVSQFESDQKIRNWHSNQIRWVSANFVSAEQLSSLDNIHIRTSVQSVSKSSPNNSKIYKRIKIQTKNFVKTLDVTLILSNNEIRKIITVT